MAARYTRPSLPTSDRPYNLWLVVVCTVTSVPSSGSYATSSEWIGGSIFSLVPQRSEGPSPAKLELKAGASGSLEKYSISTFPVPGSNRKRLLTAPLR
jgi:hypothetical protein